MVNRRCCAHNFVERGAITVGRPDFETVFRPRTERLCIRYKGFNASRRLQGLYCGQFRGQRVEQQLQCREPLLTINDGSLLHQARLVRHLLQHDCAKKVRLVLIGRVKSTRSATRLTSSQSGSHWVS